MGKDLRHIFWVPTVLPKFATVAYCGSLIYEQSQFSTSDNTIVVQSLSQDVFSTELAYYILQQLDLRSFAGGAAQPLLTQNVLKELLTVVPPSTVNVNFTKIVKIFFELKDILNQEIFNLRQTRDLLLPKLISGEIDLEDLDSIDLTQMAA